jgi:hypothetical protein
LISAADSHHVLGTVDDYVFLFCMPMG